ncbi:MAG TPA: TorF family putative porin, partial [Methylophilus sp.]
MKALSRAVLGFGKICAAAALLSNSAQAAPAASAWQSSGNLTYISDYLFRGISQTNEGMALQGSLTLANTDGWYVSSWASNIRFGEGSLELDLLAG